MQAMDGPHIQPSPPIWRRPAQTMGSANGPQPNEKAGGTGGGLPALRFLDVDKFRREVAECDHKASPSTGLNTSVPPLASPQSIYSGPPPPYSYPSSATSSILGLAGYISPPEPQRKPDDDRERQSSEMPPKPRQSLPSINEALGKDTSILYSGPPPSAPIPPQSSYPAGIISPTTPVPRSHPEPVLPGPPNPYATNQSFPPYNNDELDRRPQSSYRHGSLSEEQPLPATRRSTHEHKSYSTNSTSPASPVPATRPNPHPVQPSQQPPMFSQQPLPSSVQPSYRSFPASSGAYSYPPPANSFAYQSPLPQSGPWRLDGSEMDRAEESRKAASKRSPGYSQHYGESVKRHLDIFDLETSLNEIAEGSGRALDFSNHFGARAHQTQRSGTTSALPTIAECDEMLRRQTRVLEAMNRIRDVVVTQQHAMAEQRSRDEAKKASQAEFSDDINGYPDKSDGSGGFAGADPKKRRGRNAPPGRCHSCNRAETPEWRRGPDGARTLCNACGLHYAKLTRKMGTKASMGSSNLRPKDNGGATP